MVSRNLNRIIALEQKTLPGCVVLAIPISPNLWSISGGWGKYHGYANSEELAALEDDPSITSLVVIYVLEDENE